MRLDFCELKGFLHLSASLLHLQFQYSDLKTNIIIWTGGKCGEESYLSCSMKGPWRNVFLANTNAIQKKIDISNLSSALE